MSILRCAVSFCIAAFVTQALAAPASVTLPEGETFLADVGLYEVGWQVYDKEPVFMPAGWSDVDPRSGIAFECNQRQANRQAFVMHPPWRCGTGKEWVDYTLRLPTSGPIRLSFGVAMRLNDWIKEKASDGVTFSCYLTVDGAEQELTRTHYAEGEWKNFEFDLTPCAGKTVGLRLQVEPGPKNNSACDLCVFGDAKITAGDVAASRATMLKRLVESRAHRAVEQADLTPLVNRSGQGIAPSNLLPFRNASETSDGAYRFLYEADDCRMAYTYRPTTGTLDDLTVTVDDGPAFQPAHGGGLTNAKKNGDATEEELLRGGRLVEAKLDQDALRVVWEYDAAGQPLRAVWTFKIQGKAIVVSAASDATSICRISLGGAKAVPVRRQVKVPYFTVEPAMFLSESGLYVLTCFDWTQSHASSCSSNGAAYDLLTDGTRNALSETGYIAVSPHIAEVLPNIPWPKSPYLATLGPRIMVDVWGHYKGTFQGDAENLLALKDQGIDHVAIIQHVWQRWGYDEKLPDHMPANPEYGGDEGMIAFGKTANACGYLWSLHENYIDMYPDAPSYEENALIRESDGSPAKGWYHPITKIQSFKIKCNRSLDFAKRTAPEAHQRYGTTATYLDVHSCVAPSHLTDHEAGQPMAGMQMAMVKYDAELFQYMRDTHGGPLFGEGARHFYWAGQCDGVEAQLDDGEDHLPLLDFDLLKIHPQMVNHGMGYYPRWFHPGYGGQWGRDCGSMRQIDKYRAQEIAYGHAGFIPDWQFQNALWIAREHHLMHAVQRLYGEAAPSAIHYEVDGRFVDAGVAAAVGETSRQRIRYQSGLTVWVNWRDEPWLVEGRTLPQWGFLALGPNTEASLTLRDGRWTNFAECPEYVFADARTAITRAFEPHLRMIEPRLHAFKYLGDDRIEVTYEWIVKDRIDGDYHCFVHGTGVDDPKQILFQQDHDPPKPSSQWQPGDVIVDGPYEIRVPAGADAYDLVTGLFRPTGRIGMWCNGESADHFPIARLQIAQKDQKVVRVTAEPIPRVAKGSTMDFGDGLNPPGTWIDFGRVATDGAVKIERKADRLVVFPYPRDTEFRVNLDIKSLLPDADLSAIKLRALAAGTCEELGVVDFEMEAGRLVFKVGRPGAGRYEILLK